MMPPRNAMSRAGADRRMDVGQRRSAGEARIDMDDRGATPLAPRMTKRKATGWFSAILEPITTMQSAFARSQRAMVAAPRPNVVPRLGTDERVSDARLVLDVDHAQAAAEQLLDEVVFLIVQRGAAKRADAQGVVDRRAVGQLARRTFRRASASSAARSAPSPSRAAFLPNRSRAGRAVQHVVDALRDSSMPSVPRPWDTACLGSPGCADRLRYGSACRSWHRPAARSRRRRTANAGADACPPVPAAAAAAVIHCF